MGTADAVVAVESLNALLGALTVLMIFRLSRRHPLFWAALWGACFGAWFHSATIEVYILPLPFLLGAFALAERGVGMGSRGIADMEGGGWRRGARSLPDAIALGALHAGAVLYHQTNLLMLPCLLFALRHAGVRAICAYLAALTIGAGAPYLMAATALGSDLGAWSTTYLRELDLGHFSPSTPIKVIEGAARFFVGGHFLFATPLKEWLAARLGGEHHLADEIYLVRGVTEPAAIALAVATGVWFATTAGLFLRCARRDVSDDLRRRNRTRLQLAAAWFLPYALFFAWWEPRNVEFWIATMLPLFLAGSTLEFRGSKGKPIPALTLALVPIALLAINYLGSIRFLADPDRDWYRAQAAAYARYGSGDTIRLKDEWILGPYIERMTGATVIRAE
jgi:hypothetical protein